MKKLITKIGFAMWMGGIVLGLLIIYIHYLGLIPIKGSPTEELYILFQILNWGGFGIYFISDVSERV